MMTNTAPASPPCTAPTAPVPRTHVGLTQRSWERIRAGLRRCRENPDDRRRCLRWCRKFPEHTRAWQAILEGRHPDMVALALATARYDDVAPDARAWWERILQNHPFAAIFAPERYQELLRQRAEMRERRNPGGDACA